MHDLYLLYGATFLGCGLLLGFQARLPSVIIPRFALSCLAGFGLFHGLAEWTQMEVAGGGNERPGLRLAGLCLGAVSFAALAQFAITVFIARWRWPRWSQAVPIVLVVAFVGVVATTARGTGGDGSLSAFEVASRYLFGLPASLLASVTLGGLRRECSGQDSRVAGYLGWAGAAFGAYALFSGIIVPPGPFFPATYVNSETFFAATHLPIEVLRMACGVVIAGSLSAAFVIQAARDRAELEHRREEFISIIAHDLRSPIGAIGLGAEILEEQIGRPEGVDPQSAKRLVRNIRTGAEGLERMVRDLLDASRIETRMLALEKRPMDLRSLASDIVDRSSALTRGHGVRLVMPDKLPLVDADPIRVEQILVNLLTNAAKYGSPRTEITIEAFIRPTEVELAVTNLGGGLSPEQSEQVFSRFYRIKEHERVEGLGLGLYIVKGLVDAHGGRVWVDSEVGRYATFRFTLPRADAQLRRVDSPRWRGAQAMPGRDAITR